MENLTVKPVASRKEQKQFVDFPWKLYADDPLWIPPLLVDHRRLLGYKHHPFHDDAEMQTFLALRGSEVVGRVAAIVNHAHNRALGDRRGFFGFFESVDDPIVAHGLFDAARDWLFARGMRAIRGPANPSMNYEAGLLIEGFHSPPTFMMTYNQPYYAALVEGWGFKKAQDMFAYWGHIDMLPKLDNKLFFMSRECQKRFNVVVRLMRRDRFHAEVEMFLRVFNESFVGMWGFVPLSGAEIKVLAEGLKHLIVPEMAFVAEVDGHPIGVCLGLLDYNPRIKRINGRLFPFGFIHLLRNKRAIQKMRVISMNVVPEYQMWGLGLVLFDRLIQQILEWGMKEVEFSWVLESNTLSRSGLEKGGAKLDKTYRMYDFEPSA